MAWIQTWTHRPLCWGQSSGDLSGQVKQKQPATQMNKTNVCCVKTFSLWDFCTCGALDPELLNKWKQIENLTQGHRSLRSVTAYGDPVGIWYKSSLKVCIHWMKTECTKLSRETWAPVPALVWLTELTWASCHTMKRQHQATWTLRTPPIGNTPSFCISTFCHPATT